MIWLPPAANGETSVLEFILPYLDDAVTFLDVGCGAGKYTEKIRNWRPELIAYVADGYQPALDKVNAHVKLCLDLSKPKSLERLPSADVVVCLDVVEHLPHDQAVTLLEFLPTIGETVIVFTPMGFLENCGRHPDEAYAPWMEHKCGIEPELLELLGYKTFGWRGFDYGKNVVHDALWGVRQRR